MQRDFFKKSRIVLADAIASFRRNNDLTAASSLAFSATLALIPSLFLLTFLLGAAIGSSVQALRETQALLARFIPAYSQVILREVSFIAGHKGTIGLLNLLVLFWSITPLTADLRILLGIIFRKKPERPFLLEKLLDIAISIVFIIGFSAVIVTGVVLTVAGRYSLLNVLPGTLAKAIPVLVVIGTVFALYFTFSKNQRIRDLAAGSLAASLLWFSMRPAFHLFLVYNPGYGFAFGSFKSLFVIIIWIYFSWVLFLFGAELAASLGRGDAIFIRSLLAGKTNVPPMIAEKYVVRAEPGDVLFHEGDPGNELYLVISGSVEIRKGDRELAVIPRGKSFGAPSFLLSSPRASTAVALEEVELVMLNNENITHLMNEFPELVIEILREMAMRLREANCLID
jgi:membrane protein